MAYKISPKKRHDSEIELASELSVYALGLTRLSYFGAPEFEYKNLTSMAAQLLK
jgi:hypothetical protein